MELLLSKKEIETLNGEYSDITNNYTNKEKTVAQLFTVKVYNLMKKDYDLAYNYIDKVFKISYICEDIDLTYYDIKDSKILLTMEDSILSGFIFESTKNNVSSFLNVIKIKNDFVTTLPKKKIRPKVLTNLLIESNIKCLNSLCSTVNSELTNKITENLNDIFKYNMYIEYQFRKDEFITMPLKKEEKALLIKHYMSERKLMTESNVENYMYDMFTERLINYANLHINNLTKNLKISMSTKILDIDYLYKQVSQGLNGLIVELINQPIYTSAHRKKDLILLDWLFIKDDIFKLVESKKKEQSYKNFFKYSLAKINNIYIDIYDGIERKCQDYDTFSVTYGYAVERICKNQMNKIFNKSIIINKISYRCVFLAFYDINDKLFALDNHFNIDDILSLKITHNGKLIYAVPEETKDLLMEYNNHLLHAIKESRYTCIDHSKNKNINDLKLTIKATL